MLIAVALKVSILCQTVHRQRETLTVSVYRAFHLEFRQIFIKRTLQLVFVMWDVAAEM